MALKKQFLIFIILIILIPLGLMTGGSYYLRSKFYVEREKNNIKNDIIGTKKVLKNFTKDIENMLTFLSRDSKIIDRQNFKLILTDILKQKKELSLIYVAEEETGNFYGMSKDFEVDSKTVEGLSHLPKGYDPRVRPWYKGTVNSGKFYISDVYTDLVTHKSIVTLGLPLIKENKLWGVLAVDIDLKEFSKQLNLESYFESYINILDSKGNIIISSKESDLGKVNKRFKDLNNDFGEISLKNDKNIYLYEKIKDLNLCILVQINRENIQKEFEPLKLWALTIGFVSFIIALIFILILFNTLESFFNKLSLILESIAKGNYKNNFEDFEKLVGSNKDFHKIKNSLEKMQLQVQNREGVLENLANRDTLTMLYNRRYLFDTLDKEFEKAQFWGINFIVAILDLDNFKLINDTFGHQQGDKVLQKVSTIFQNSIREQDILGRYGGEEFLIIFTNITLKEVLVLLENLRSSVESVEWEHESLKTTVSIGVSDYCNQSLEKMLQEADYYLYEAKHNGKNKIEFKRD